MTVLPRETGLICTDIDRFTGPDLQCSQPNTNHKQEKGEDEIHSDLVLFDVIHQKQPGHDLLLKSVIQLS